MISGKKFMVRKKRKAVFTVGAIGISATILGILVYSQWDVLVNHTWDIKIMPLVYAFVTYSIILLLNVLTWTSIMNQLGSTVGFGTHFRSTTISALGKRLPGTFWYVLWRVEIYRQDISGKLIAFASWIEMAVTIIAAVLISIFFSIPLILNYKYSIIVVLVLTAIAIFALHPKVITWVLKKIRGESIRIRSGFLFLWIANYMLIWVFVGLLLFCIANILISVPIYRMGYFIGCVALTGLLSRLFLFSPSAFGITEVGLSLLLSNIMPSSFAVLIAIANRIIIMIFEIFWATISTISIRLPISKSE
jgi:hypothetical protein